MSKLKVVLAAALAALGAFAPASANASDDYAIKIVTGSEINMVARDSRVPLIIRNDYQSVARVLVHVVPSNERLLVPEVTAVSIPAFTTYTAKVPVRAVSSGDVDLSVWLTSASGVKLTDPVTVSMHINSDVEIFAVGGFVLFVVLLLGTGIVRTFRKRKAE